MVRCSHCGRISRDGSVFCQDCGHQLEARAREESEPVAPSTTPAPDGVCKVCGASNPPGMNFCKMCGAPLRVGQPIAPVNAPAGTLRGPAGSSRAPGQGKQPSSSQAAANARGPTSSTRCAVCNTQVVVGFAFCQHCGAPLTATPPGGLAIRPGSHADPAAVGAAGAGLAASGAVSAAVGGLASAGSGPSVNAGAIATAGATAGASANTGGSGSGGVGAGANPGGSVGVGIGTGVPVPVAVHGPGFHSAPIAASQQRSPIRLPSPPAGSPALPGVASQPGGGAIGGGHGFGFQVGGLPAAADVITPSVRGGLVSTPHPATAEPADSPADSSEDAFAPTIVPESVAALPAFGAAIPRAALANASEECREGSGQASANASAPPFARLVSIRRDLSDGDAHRLVGEHVDIGRSEGTLLFREDRYLAPRHVRIERRGSSVFVRALDDVNGVFVRIREPWPLEDSTCLMLGKEVLLFELVDPEESETLPLSQHGIMLLGSPPRPAWGRIRQIGINGLTRDIIHLGKPEVVIGREEGDICFHDDEFMSRRHAALCLADGHTQVRDLGSSNGTFVRLQDEYQLHPRDLLRIGSQLFRYEPG
ncbi:MAG: FHA domain-containing protein [Pseudomonadota bacterium]